MSQRFTTSYVNTVRPGAYIKSTVKSTPAGLGDTGNILIIGEAVGGPDFASEETLANNFFTADQADQVAQKYVSGPIVDAMNMLANPSNDADITGAPGRVYIMKTNKSTKASSSLPAYGTLSDLNWGKDGNKYSYKVTKTQAETAPSVTSDDLSVAMATPTVFNDLNFSLRLSGGAIASVTLSSTTADHNTVALLAAEIDSLLPAGVSCEDDGNTIVITMDADPSADSKGWGKSIELVDSTPGDLAVVGLDAGLIVSASEPAVEINIVRPDIDANEILAASASVDFEIGYAGATATMTILNGMLTTTVTGGVGANLSISLADHVTISSLVSYIQSQPGYSVSNSPSIGQKSPMTLDEVSAIGIASTMTNSRPGRVKRSKNSFVEAMAVSQYLEATITAGAGLPAATPTYMFLSGGAMGGTTGANYLDALTAAEGLSVNFVVPLFSRDASLDIADKLTDASSTYTIDAIHAATKNHDLKMSQIKMKRNRQGLLAYDGTFAESKVKSASLSNYRHTLSFQKIQQVDSSGNLQVFGAWMEAVCAAGMQSAGFYQALVNKLANVVSYVDPSDFDSGKPGDVEEAIEAGLLFLERTSAGIRWVTDQTTYGFDSNFVYNSLQAVYAKDMVELDLAASMERAFVGKSLADVDIATVISFISNKMDGYKRLKLIAGSDDAPAGYRNVSVEIDGPAMYLKLEIKLATALYFVGIEMEVSQVKRSGSQE